MVVVKGEHTLAGKSISRRGEEEEEEENVYNNNFFVCKYIQYKSQVSNRRKERRYIIIYKVYIEQVGS